jgi:hypothetical protein
MTEARNRQSDRCGMSQHIVFVAEWYDTKKVESRARAAGWNGVDSLLDSHHPEEDSGCVSTLQCADLKSAVTHLRNIVASGQEFFGSAEILEIELGGRRCGACICRGRKVVKRHVVDETGVIETHADSDCLDEEVA